MSTIVELEIGAGEELGTYVARVLRSAGVGTASAKFRLDVDRLIAGLPLIEATVVASAVPSRRLLSAGESEIHRVGRLLFDTVFTGSVETAYRASRAVARERGDSLQVRLRLTDPPLAALPWESLFDSSAHAYICRKDPLIRQFPSSDTLDVLRVDPPLRVLAMIAAPRDLPKIDAKSEQALLETSLESHIAGGRILLEWLDEVTWRSVHEKLLSAPWHVLHFVGHGSFDPSTDEGVLAFVGQDGNADYVDASRLADLLDQAEPTPRLVVINSCMSGAGGTTELFSGTAAALVNSGIHAVAAMQFAISDPAALAFSRGFYSALAYGRRIDEAIVSGRIEILGLGRNTLEWVTPVLCLRGEETRLFDLTPPEPPRPEEPGVATESDEQKVAVQHDDVPLAPLQRAWSRYDPDVALRLDEMATAGHPDLAAPVPPLPAPAAPPLPPVDHSTVRSERPSREGVSPPLPPRPEPRERPGASKEADRRRRRIGFLIAGVLLAVGSVAAILVALSLDTAENLTLPADLMVAADSGLASVHVRCEEGEHLHLSASGEVQHGGSSDESASPDGMDGVFMDDNPLPSANHLTLIGKLGDTTFVVGNTLAVACPAAVDLELGVNDGEPTGNTGGFTVSIRDVTGNQEVVPGAFTPTRVTVEPKSPWTRTPITCVPGAVYRVQAIDTMSWGNPAITTVDADGVEQGSDDPGWDPARNLDDLEDDERGMLVGALDGQPPYSPLGVEARFTCEGTGQLDLGMNDRDFDDNEGGFVVTLTRVVTGAEQPHP